jgi:hypothetical protein
MNKEGIRFYKRSLTTPGILAVVVIALVSTQSTTSAADNLASATSADQSSFFTETAIQQSSPGTPVGPPKKVVICHNGRTIRVSEAAVPAHLAHGDTLGPCVGDYVICNRYGNFDNNHPNVPIRTIIVSQADLPKYLAKGATIGPCPNQVFMCNNRGKTITVTASNVDAHLSAGHQLGLCPGKTLICHKGHSIVVKDAELSKHLAHGDCIGYCLGAAGPLIDEVSRCASNPPTSMVSQ